MNGSSRRRFFVVTPVLNGAKYLPAALSSIDVQSFPDWIHYVVDGGSTDATLDIVRASIEKEPRRRLIRGKDKGLYDALFKGFDAIEADGLRDDDICLWLNADDYLAPWAFSTMAQAFDLLAADWITGQPGQWDSEGRLVLIQPSSWYPRWCITHGWFNGACLGWIQQESTFFTARLLRLLQQDVVGDIRAMKMAGDFVLWKTFAKLRPLRAVPTLIGGFRSHGENRSIYSGAAHYRRELRTHGAFLPPVFIGRSLRLFYRVTTAIIAAIQARHPISAKPDRTASN